MLAIILFFSTWQSPEVGLFICYNYSISLVPASFQAFHFGTSSSFRISFWTGGYQEPGAAVRKDPSGEIEEGRVLAGQSVSRLPITGAPGKPSLLPGYPGLPPYQSEGRWGLANILLGTEGWVEPSRSRGVSLDLPPCPPSQPSLTTLVRLFIPSANIY